MKLRNVELNNYIYNENTNYEEYLTNLRNTRKLNRKTAHLFRDSYDPKEWKQIRDFVINSSDNEFNKFLTDIDKVNTDVLNRFKNAESKNSLLLAYVTGKTVKITINNNIYLITINNKFNEIRIAIEISDELTFMYIKSLNNINNIKFDIKDGNYYNFKKTNYISKAYLWDSEINKDLKNQFILDLSNSKIPRLINSLLDTLNSFFNK